MAVHLVVMDKVHHQELFIQVPVQLLNLLNQEIQVHTDLELLVVVHTVTHGLQVQAAVALVVQVQMVNQVRKKVVQLQILKVAQVV